ncbi:MAG: metallophosphoesterase [Burkholderiaceae bacterium]|nr:metallophosphoesterase [Burkholderiaceae bacterium]
MRVQILSDLHMETETFEPEPAPGAEALILAGDVDTHWAGLDAFAGWPVPVLFVPGNHEFDRRDIALARPALRERVEQLGFVMLDDAECSLTDRAGRRLRFLGSTRWSDFDLFGLDQRPRSMRAGSYFQRLMGSSLAGEPLDCDKVRALSLESRAWLSQALTQDAPAQPWAATVVITHFAPSLRSADPRFGRQPTTASFCNNDEDLLPLADVWIHGHLHCRQDYQFSHARGQTRVLCNARGHQRKGESQDFNPLLTLDIGN